MSCPERLTYISNPYSATELENIRQSTLKEIDYCFGPTNVKGTPGTYTIRRRTDGQILKTIPEDVNIYVLEREIANQFFSGQKGCYIAQGNKIILNPRNWCKKTLIHECLHSVSCFSEQLNSAFFKKTRFFVEGTTEFLTGLLLFGNHEDCYENWLHNRYKTFCGLGYPRETRMIFAFCCCVDPQILVDLYFGNMSIFFPDAWNIFTESISQYSNCRFKDVFDDGMKIGLINAFDIECEQQFKKKYRDFKRRQMDYNLLKQ